MSKKGTKKQRIEDRPINYVKLFLTTESGCDVSHGEYMLEIASVIGSLNITYIGGVDDVSLIKNCIENNLDFTLLTEECTAEIILRESGEWEDVFWNKYYEIERVVIHDHN